jgi:transcriptional regulator
MLYLQSHYEETDTGTIRSLVTGYPLGMLITLGNDGISANHIPFLLDEQRGQRGALIGHVARNNALCRDHDPAIETLVVFQGPSAYISPNWYPTKQITHQVVPTYNYAVVHVYGQLIVHDDQKWLRGVVGKLTKAMEARQPEPWRMGQAPVDFIETQLGTIVGVEIAISRVYGKWKMSQNRPVADREGAAAGLQASGDPVEAEVAGLILERTETARRLT